jgi:hypothetical protein
LLPPDVIDVALVFTVKVPATPFCFNSLPFIPEPASILPFIVMPPSPVKLISPPRPGVVFRLKKSSYAYLKDFK